MFLCYPVTLTRVSPSGSCKRKVSMPHSHILQGAGRAEGALGVLLAALPSPSAATRRRGDICPCPAEPVPCCSPPAGVTTHRGWLQGSLLPSDHGTGHTRQPVHNCFQQHFTTTASFTYLSIASLTDKNYYSNSAQSTIL